LFSLSDKATESGEGAVAEIVEPPNIMLPPPAKPNAWIKERLFHKECSLS
jgi:hypothetical protein